MKAPLRAVTAIPNGTVTRIPWARTATWFEAVSRDITLPGWTTQEDGAPLTLTSPPKTGQNVAWAGVAPGAQGATTIVAKKAHFEAPIRRRCGRRPCSSMDLATGTVAPAPETVASLFLFAEIIESAERSG